MHCVSNKEQLLQETMARSVLTVAPIVDHKEPQSQFATIFDRHEMHRTLQTRQQQASWLLVLA
jgi:hypothetical protein